MPQLQPHIRLDHRHGAVCALLPGDPARLDRIRTFLTDVEELAYNREFRSLVGSFQGVKVLAVSTGIGGASAGIAVEELHNLGLQNMIRIGSCGALQPQIRIGDLILASGAVRDDGASKTYIDPIFPAVPDSELLFACVSAAKAHKFRYHTGIARSHDSFYTDRERKSTPIGPSAVCSARIWRPQRSTRSGHLRGIRTMSILNNVVAFEEDTAGAIGSYVDGETAAMQGEEHEIIVALDAFAQIVQPM